VWRAWTDPAALALWWGPKGFTAPRCEFDARPGGAICIDMLQADGTVYPMDGTIEAISPPGQLTFVCGALNSAGKRLFDVRNSLTLEDDGEGTRLTLDVRVIAIHDAAAANHLPGMEIGWNQSLDKLAERCIYRRTQHGSFSLERLLTTSPARVFAAFASAKAKAAWFTAPSEDWSLQIRELDFRPNGRERLAGRWKSGTTTDFRAIYHDIVPDRRIVYTYAMHLNAVRISVSLAVVDIEPHGAGARLTLTDHGAFLDGFDDAGSRERGTSDLLDQLERSLTA
jgi:uncharacterized protein YndB with AHSA1/START domain